MTAPLTREEIEEFCEAAIGIWPHFTRPKMEALRDMALRSLDQPRVSAQGETPETNALKSEWNRRSSIHNGCNASPEAMAAYDLAERLERERDEARMELAAANERADKWRSIINELFDVGHEALDEIVRLAESLTEIERFEAENAALRKDAERYRWIHNGDVEGLIILKGVISEDDDISALIDGEKLDKIVDAAIDAAIAAEKGKP